MHRFVALCAVVVALSVAAVGRAAEPFVKNVVFILSDDHRYDFMHFHPRCPKWLETPAMDRMAAEGAHVANAFVSTSLCSPSRASILTGLYMHHHKVVDNQHPVRPGVTFFPQYLQKAGVQTAFIGKWHMGHDNDDPRPGFDYWASFKGQGTYFDPELNVNGKHVQLKGYNTDVLTKVAMDWLADGRDKSKPFFMYLSYKAVHYPFVPAPRHAGMYADKPIDWPETRGRTEQNYRTQPNWVRERRYSIHGIDHMETGPFDKDPVPDLDALYHQYAETVHGLDENLGKLMAYLDSSGLAKDTLVIYMGDNGFHLGEHGFYDKRDAFETSMRVPMLAWAPGHIKPGTVVTPMVQNIDIAPTVMDAMGVAAPESAKFDGRSFLPLLRGETVADWRDHILYEYHWEWNFPATPTLFAIRTDRYKYVYYHGTWDIDSLHDLQTDPDERHNLIQVPAYQKLATKLRDQMFKELEASGALDVPVRPPHGDRLGQRKLPE
ncbi:MAG: sulfatase-like hydrolase/transferase [Phycisphaera sp.]|nr:sulfatase-like hydrolase/transferase [Phycisphaera sp.]